MSYPTIVTLCVTAIILAIIWAAARATDTKEK